MNGGGKPTANFCAVRGAGKAHRKNNVEGTGDHAMNESTPQWPYIWRWAKYPTNPSEWKPGRFKGMRCRVLVRGGKNMALIEFEDGYKTITSRNGLKKNKRG